MATQTLAKALAGHRLIALDSCVLIYHLEQHECFAPAAGEVLSHIQQGKAQAVLSTLVLLEVQVGPYRKQANDLADYYYALLGRLANCHWIPVSYEIADRAAQLRAEHKLAAPDAIHLATAAESSATLFVTNDRSLPAIPGLAYAIVGGN